jgi:membrane-bound lytic murein transglycosylase F
MRKAGWLALAALTAVMVWRLLLAAGTHAVDSSDWTDNYDPYFRKYAKHYFGPNLDWRWFKAQAIAESGLRSKARSKAGAVGVMQIVPSTFREIQKDNPHFTDIASPRWNIAAGIYYDRQLYRRWQDIAYESDLLYFAFASYNTGHERISSAADKVGKTPARWKHVGPYTPKQTRHYVKRIRVLMEKPAVQHPSAELVVQDPDA